jgi:hypothetical protein
LPRVFQGFLRLIREKFAASQGHLAMNILEMKPKKLRWSFF